MQTKAIGTLYYSHNLNPRVAVAAARHLGAPVKFVRADPMGKDQQAFRAINPNTLVPVLVEETRTLWETDAIVMRLSALMDDAFWPPDRTEEVMQWVSWSAHHFTKAGGTFYFENIIVPRYFDRPADWKALEEAHEDLQRFGAVLDDHLAGRTWLVGEALTYADFRVASALPFAAEARLPLDGFRNIQAWYARIDAIDAWRDPFNGLG
ncbi:glutathione S-transferase family protein [Pseudoxanthomonas putridarboris]|uniref:Glutathione S-transferase family protein n=1 Tax=Pseudoxanthomonas putridarboris TaxID=752605 RepID=A0ABU9J2I2_9GAMM